MTFPSSYIGAPWKPGLPPGVYEDRPIQSTVRDVRMDVAAFVGLTERGPVSTPVIVESWEAFRYHFGRPGGGRLLPDSVRLFFANGGRRCVVVRALNYRAARTAKWFFPVLKTDNGDKVCFLARNPGSWGNCPHFKVDFPLRELQFIVPRPDDDLPTNTALARIGHGLQPGALVRFIRTNAGELIEKLLFVSKIISYKKERDQIKFKQSIDSEFQLDVNTVSSLNPRDTKIFAASEVRINLDISLEQGTDVELGESWPNLAFHPLHTDFIVRRLGKRSAGERYMLDQSYSEHYPDAEFFGENQIDSALLSSDSRRSGSFLVRPPWNLWNQPLVPDAKLIESDATYASRPSDLDTEQMGNDGALEMERQHFFSRPQDSLEGIDLEDDRKGPGLYVFADQPSPLDALNSYDDPNETEPVSLVYLPDLAHPRQFETLADTENSTKEEMLRFGKCVFPGTPAMEPDLPYPKLAVSHDINGLRDKHVELAQWCEQHSDRIAILDLPPGLVPGEIINWRRRIASQRAILYAPYLHIRSLEQTRSNPLVVGPGGAVCGIIAKKERLARVHAAPANEVLEAVVSLHEDSRLPSPGFLHTERVNAIRATAFGITLLGSRTTDLGLEWTHLSVRRLLDYLERQLALDTRWAVFEPNNRALWGRLTDTAEARLRPLHDVGAFQGAGPAQAYFIRCDGTINTSDVLDRGQVVILVGVAPSVPAEFIVFRLTQINDGASIVEEFHG